MEQDYKEQLRMMTEGLGEWMDRRERAQRRRRRWLRVAMCVVAVAVAVVLQVFLPWRRETVKYIYVVDTVTVAAEQSVHKESMDDKITDGLSFHKKVTEPNLQKVVFVGDDIIEEKRMPVGKIPAYIDSLRACYKNIIVKEEEARVAIVASNRPSHTPNPLQQASARMIPHLTSNRKTHVLPKWTADAWRLPQRRETTDNNRTL